MTSHYFGQKSTLSPLVTFRQKYSNPPSNTTSQFATPHLLFAITNFHLFCVCLDKNLICFIDLICARCGKTNTLFVKRRKYCTHR